MGVTEAEEGRRRRRSRRYLGGDDPSARDAWAELSEQLQARYGIDLDALASQQAGTDGPVEQVASAVREQVEQAQQGGPPAEEPGDRTRSGRTTGQATPAARRWEAEVLRVAGAELGAEIIAAEAWYHLQNRLDKYQAAGEDPSGHLSEALAKGGLALLTTSLVYSSAE